MGWSSDKAQDFSDPYAAKLELVKAEKAKREAERDAEEAAKHTATAAKMEEAARAEEAAKAEAAAKEAAEESAAAAAATEDAEVPAVASGATFPCESLKGMVPGAEEGGGRRAEVLRRWGETTVRERRTTAYPNPELTQPKPSQPNATQPNPNPYPHLQP